MLETNSSELPFGRSLFWLHVCNCQRGRPETDVCMRHKWNVQPVTEYKCVSYLLFTEGGAFSFCQVEKRLELVKQVSHSTHKKLTACLQGQQAVDVDKKSVRSPSVRLRGRPAPRTI